MNIFNDFHQRFVISLLENQIENYDVPFLSFEDLIINKMVARRLKDQADVEELQKIHRKQ